jgi:hypothetical protein
LGLREVLVQEPNDYSLHFVEPSGGASDRLERPRSEWHAGNEPSERLRGQAGFSSEASKYGHLTDGDMATQPSLASVPLTKVAP